MDILEQLHHDTVTLVLDLRRNRLDTGQATQRIEQLDERATVLGLQIQTAGGPALDAWAFGDGDTDGYLQLMAKVLDALRAGDLDTAEQLLGTTTGDLTSGLPTAVPSLADRCVAARDAGAGPVELWSYLDTAKRIAPDQVQPILEVLRAEGIYRRP